MLQEPGQTMQFKVNPKRKAFINITSLVDVLFLLLIFFMVSSTFLEQPGMKLNLPGAKSTEIESKQDLIVEISAEGSIAINGKPVLVEGLQGELALNINNLTDATLVLKADESVPHGKVVKVMDIARSAGVRKLIVATKIEN